MFTLSSSTADIKSVSSDTASDVADNISFVFIVSVATFIVIKVILNALLACPLTDMALRRLGNRIHDPEAPLSQSPC